MSEAITNEQLGRLIDILFYLPVYKINNWGNDNAMINSLASQSGFTIDEVRRFMPLFLSNLRSIRTVNGTPIDFTSSEKLIDLFGKDKFRNGREQLISSFLNLMNNKSSGIDWIKFLNSVSQVPGFYELQYESTKWAASALAKQWLGPQGEVFMSNLFNLQQTNPGNNAISQYDTNQNQLQSYQVSQANQNPEIDKLVNFLESILNGSYWQRNTRINLEVLRDLNFNVGQIRAFVERLENANSFVSRRILNYQSVRNLISKIDRNVPVDVNDVANVLFDLSEIYPDVNRNENIPPFEKPRDFSKE